MKEISITEIKGISIGQAENMEAATGVTAIVAKEGMSAGLDVRGGGPASRESELLKPLASEKKIHSIVLGGGSAYGLDAAGGVMECLEKNEVGYEVGICRVPLVCQSDLFDLTVGDYKIRPDKAMGYEACQAALSGGNYKDGNYGAGCGASVGKWKGMETAMKTGIGSYAIQIGNLQVGAIVAVNALGDIYDHKSGKKIAGLLTEDKKAFRNTVEVMMESTEIIENKFTGNTTIGVIITNGDFKNAQLCKIASMAHNGYARSIRPVHTSADGDSIYAVSTGAVAADMDLVGTLAAEVMSQAITRAVTASESAYGLPSAKDI